MFLSLRANQGSYRDLCVNFPRGDVGEKVIVSLLDMISTIHTYIDPDSAHGMQYALPRGSLLISVFVFFFLDKLSMWSSGTRRLARWLLRLEGTQVVPSINHLK